MQLFKVSAPTMAEGQRQHGKRAITLFALIWLMGAPNLYADDIYTWVDENGNRVYSDAPRDGAKKVKLKPAMRMEFPEPRQTTTSSASTNNPGLDQVTTGYSQISWVTPTTSQNFPVGAAGNVPVAIQTVPNLQPGHQVEFYANGQKVGSFVGTAGTLQNMPRGEYSLVAKVVNKEKVLGQTGSVRIIVQRAKVAGK